MAWYDSLYGAALGSPQQITQAPTVSTQAQNTINQLLSRGVQQLEQNPPSFAPIAQRARTQFQQNTIPTLLERFNALGGGTHSSKPSSGLAGVISGAGENLNEGLAALESQYNQRQQELGQGLIRLGLTPSFENLVTPPQPGALHAVAPEIGKGLLSAASSGIGSFVDKIGAPAAAALATSLAGAAPLALPIIGGLAAVAGLGYAGKKAYDNWPTISNWFSDKWTRFKNWVTGRDNLQTIVADAPPGVADYIKNNQDQLRQFFSNPATPSQIPPQLRDTLSNLKFGGQQGQQGQGLDELMANQKPVNAQPVPQPAPQPARVNPVAVQPQVPQRPAAPAPAPAPVRPVTPQQKPKVTCKNGKCKIRRR